MPRLTCNPGQPDEAVFEISASPVVIGRAPGCKVRVVHKSLSRRHAQIEIAGGRITISDLQSKNGTFVNGVRVERREIHPGDTVRVGDVALVFSFEDAPSRDSNLPARPAERRSQAAATRASEPEVQPTLFKDIARVSFGQFLRTAWASEAPDAASSATGRRAQERLQSLFKVSQFLASHHEIDALLRKILDLVFQILPVDRGAILLLDPKTGQLEPRVVKPESAIGDETSSDGGGPVYSRQIVEYVQTRSVAALFRDAAADPRIDPTQSVFHQSIRSSICVPLRPKDDTIGVLYVDNVSLPDCFSEEDLDFLTSFANQAAIAIENATLYERIEEETMSRMQLVMDAKLASLGSVVAGIAHEIKNPLNFITNFAKLTEDLSQELEGNLREQRERLDPETLADVDDVLGMMRGNAAKIHEHGQKATNIINAMLRHARGGSGVREACDLNAILAESVRLACYSGLGTDDLGAEIDAEYDASIGPVEVVGANLSRVFVNVIQNACDAMRQKRRALGASYAPALTLRTADRGDRVEVRIRDNGTGIPQDLIDKIWNPFFTTKPPGEGTGLGLSLSHDIVVQGHQGKMGVTTAPGEFTEFLITLPKRAVRSTDAAVKPGTVPPPIRE
jgi:signal transduction histidine kinase